jgi:putative ABC transport system permease protein
LKAHTFEYALLAVIAALVAIALGSLIAWVAVTQVMETDFVFSVNAVLETLAIAALMIMAFGGLGTWAVLRAPAVPYLRSE